MADCSRSAGQGPDAVADLSEPVFVMAQVPLPDGLPTTHGSMVRQPGQGYRTLPGS